MKYVNCTIEESSVGGGLVYLDAGNMTERTIIPVDSIAWWSEFVETNRVSFRLTNGDEVIVRFNLDDGGEAWTTLIESLWDAKVKRETPTKDVRADLVALHRDLGLADGGTSPLSAADQMAAVYELMERHGLKVR